MKEEGIREVSSKIILDWWFCRFIIRLPGVFDKTVCLVRCCTESLKVALKVGSSQDGNIRRIPTVFSNHLLHFNDMP